MEKSSKPSLTALAAETIERLAKLLDPFFPSVIIPPDPRAIDDNADYYGAGRVKPDFVRRDDEDWTGPALE